MPRLQANITQATSPAPSLLCPQRVRVTCPGHPGIFSPAWHLHQGPGQANGEMVFLQKKFLIKYSRFIMFLQFQLYSRVTPSHVYVDWFYFFTLSSVTVHPKRLDMGPCTVQRDLVAFPLSMYQFALPTPDSPSVPLSPRNHRSVPHGRRWCFCAICVGCPFLRTGSAWLPGGHRRWCPGREDCLV